MRRIGASSPLVGQTVRSRDLGPLKVTQTAYASNLVISDHCHPFPYFCAVLRGAFTDFSGSSERSCRPTTVFFRPAGQVHADQFGQPGAQCLVVELRPALCDRLGLRPNFLSTSGEFLGGRMFSLAGRLFEELQDWDDFSELSVEGLVLELISQAGRSTAKRSPAVPPWLRRALELLDGSFKDHVTLSDIAEKVCVHPTHLARAFRAACGCTVGDYLRRKRIDHCCARLSRSGAPLIEIALEAGFADQSHFSRVFRRIVGESPGAYRRRVGNAR